MRSKSESSLANLVEHERERSRERQRRYRDRKRRDMLVVGLGEMPRRLAEELIERGFL